MIDTGDPLAYAAQLFDMATYMTVAMFEPSLFIPIRIKKCAPRILDLRDPELVS